MTHIEPLPEPSTDPAELQAALEALAATDRLLVALDFDGTLAPTVDRPEDARAVPAAREAIERLVALEDTWVAYVSGRALDSLIEVTEPDDKILLIGSHGVEVRLDDPDAEASLSPEESARAAEVERLLDQIAAVYDNVWVERKPAGFALHTRRADDDDALEAGKRALADLSLPGVTIRDGKDVLEFSVRSATKGDGIEELRRYTGATAALYAGDDVTDEDAFAVLHAEDLPLKSGDGATIAPFRVGGPDEVAATLAALATAREAAIRAR